MSWGVNPLTAASATASAESVEAGLKALSAAAMGSAVALALKESATIEHPDPLCCGGRGSVVAYGDNALARKRETDVPTQK